MGMEKAGASVSGAWRASGAAGQMLSPHTYHLGPSPHLPAAGRKGSPWPSILGDSGYGRPELPVSSAEASVATARQIKVLSPLIFPYFLLSSIPSFLVSSLPCLSLRALFSKPSTYNLPSQTLFLAQSKITPWASVQNWGQWVCGLNIIGVQVIYIKWQHF